MRARRVGICGLLAVLLCVMDVAVAETGGRVWRRELRGGGVSDVTVDTARHISVTGSAWARPVMPGTKVHVTAMLVARYGPAGRLVWRRTWRRSGLWFAAGLAVAPAPSGGVYVGGISGRYEGWSPLLWRYSASGRLRWRRTLPSPLGRGEMSSIATDLDGVIAAVNNSATGGPTAGGNFVYAFDHAGRVVWRTEFEAPGITGTMNRINGVAIGGDHRVYAVGSVSRSPLDARYQDWDVVVQQLDRDGRVRWTRVLPDPGVRDFDAATAVSVGSHRVVVGGSINDTQGAVWAFTREGRRSWERHWASGANAVEVAPSGAVYVAASRTVYGPGSTSTTTSTLRRYTPTGTLVWKRLVSKDGGVTGVTAGGGLYLTVGGGLERWRR